MTRLCESALAGDDLLTAIALAGDHAHRPATNAYGAQVQM
jgi:hypothetical protein